MDDVILLKFSKSPDGRFSMEFSDPAYVRSEIIILNRSDNSVHAVLEGAERHVGFAGRDVMGQVTDKAPVTLSAPHYHKGIVRLTSQVAVR